jgi:transcriptional regulator with XRE-family HTH domain
MKKLNVVGRQIGRLRYQHGMTQEELAAKLQSAGWETATRSCVSKIESGLIKVPDYMLYCFSSIFQMQAGELLPKFDSANDVHDIIRKFMRDTKHRSSLPRDEWF